MPPPGSPPGLSVAAAGCRRCRRSRSRRRSCRRRIRRAAVTAAAAAVAAGAAAAAAAHVRGLHGLPQPLMSALPPPPPPPLPRSAAAAGRRRAGRALAVAHRRLQHVEQLDLTRAQRHPRHARRRLRRDEIILRAGERDHAAAEGDARPDEPLLGRRHLEHRVRPDRSLIREPLGLPLRAIRRAGEVELALRRAVTAAAADDRAAERRRAEESRTEHHREPASFHGSCLRPASALQRSCRAPTSRNSARRRPAAAPGRVDGHACRERHSPPTRVCGGGDAAPTGRRWR